MSTGSAVKEYIYHPLNSSNQEIRLITIKAGCEPEPIECFLTHVSLGDKPQYEALSYVWGDPNNRSHIILEGCDFSVTSNLGTALPYLRLPEAPRTMWIDAICIDQSNLSERESQIQLMRSIFQEAKQVVSWMHAPEREGEAIETASLLREGQDNDFSTAWFRGALSGDGRTMRRIGSIAIFCTSIDYWSRIWITQEVALARKGVVQWGKMEMPYEYFVKFSRTFLEVLKDYEWAEKHLDLGEAHIITELFKWLERNDMVRRINPGTPLLDLLQQNSYKNATDPRDKVYALLGLSDMAPDSHEGLTINYGENSSKGDVYAGVVRAVVHKTSRLEIICYARPYANIMKTSSSPDKQELAIPSWAPDWNDFVRRPLSSPMTSKVGAAGLTSANVEFSDDRKVMKVQGICIGAVGTYGRCIPYGTFEEKPEEIMLCREIYYEWLELCRDYAGDSENTLDTLFRAITLGRGAPQELKDLVARKNQRSDSSNPPSVPVAEYFSLLQRCTGGCRLFTMDPMEDCLLSRESMPLLIGIGPEELQKKDMICILAGCKIPVALRPDGNRYRFVSPVFIDRLADGQAIEWVAMGLYSWDWFEMH